MARVVPKLVVVVLAFGAVAQAWVLTRVSSDVAQRCDTSTNPTSPNKHIPSGSTGVGKCCDAGKNGTRDPVQMCFHEDSKRFTLTNNRDPKGNRRRYFKISSQRSSDSGATFVAYFTTSQRETSYRKNTWPFHGKKVWSDEIIGHKTDGNQHKFWHVDELLSCSVPESTLPFAKNDGNASCDIKERPGNAGHHLDALKIEVKARRFHEWCEGKIKAAVMTVTSEYSDEQLPLPKTTYQITTLDKTTFSTYFQGFGGPFYKEYVTIDENPEVSCPLPATTTKAAPNVGTRPNHAHDQDTATTTPFATTNTGTSGPVIIVATSHLRTIIIVILVLLVLILICCMIMYLRSQKDEPDPQPAIDLPCLPLVVPAKPGKCINATDEFHGRVTVAMDHFTANPGDVRVVKLFSERTQLWHRNTFEERAKFRPIPVGPEDDVTEEFFGHVTNAVDHFMANRGDARAVKMISVSEGKWYRNTIKATSDFTPIPEALLPDVTGEFHGHVIEAHDHFKLTGFQNDGRHVKVYSERDGRYYQNSLAAPGEFHPVPER